MLMHPALDQETYISQDVRQEGDMSHMSLASYSLAI